MKKRKIIACLTAMMLMASEGSVLRGNAIEKNRLDVNADGVVNVYDLALAKRLGTYAAAECREIADYLLKRPVTVTETPDVPIDESAVLEAKGTIHTGEATYYDGGYEGGCAMLDPISRDDYWVVAMNLADYNNAQLAGAYIEVTGELGSIRMLVTDLLPEGKKGDLDLCEDAFPLIAPAIKGRVPIQWKIIPLDSAENAPVSYRFKEGSSPYWCGVQVRNHRYPITKLEYLRSDGTFEELPRQRYNYFESDRMGAGPYTFRITDIYGQVIIDENIPLKPEQIVSGSQQFPK